MWEVTEDYVRNPSSANRYDVVVRSEMIRNPQHEARFDVIYAGAQEALDSFNAWGVQKRFDITWHEEQDGSDDPQRWSTQLS